MQQLVLDVGLADYARFESFFAGPNAATVHAMTEAAAVRSRAILWLSGKAGVGKTHLLQACVSAANDAGYRAAYLPLGPGSELIPAALDGMGELDVICVDDVDAVAGNADWERALFLLYEAARASNARLIMSASQAPAHCFFDLPDLASRFASAAAFRMHELSDEDKLSALQLRAKWRGIELPDDVAAYLMKRVDRSTGNLFDVLDKLDREALAARKKLTIAFVRSVLSF
jgi:DnaA family protein